MGGVLIVKLCIENQGGGCGRGTFLDFGVLKPGFRWVIKFTLTSILVPSVYYDCSTRDWEKLLKLFSDVLDIRGRGGRGYPLPTMGSFLDFGVLKSGFGCIIKLKLTSILPPNIYCSTRGRGGPFIYVHTKGGIPLSWYGIFRNFGTKHKFFVH